MKNEGFKPPIHAFFFALKNEGCEFRWKNVPPKKTDHFKKERAPKPSNHHFFSGYVKGPVGVWLTVWWRKDVDIWPPKMVVWLFASNNFSFSIRAIFGFPGVHFILFCWGVYIGLHMAVECIKLKQNQPIGSMGLVLVTYMYHKNHPNAIYQSHGCYGIDKGFVEENGALWTKLHSQKGQVILPPSKWGMQDLIWRHGVSFLLRQGAIPTS